MKFSDRIEVTNLNSVIQTNSISDGLRNMLWNSLNVKFFNLVKPADYDSILEYTGLMELATNLWMYYFKLPLEETPHLRKDFINYIKKYIKTCEWYDVYNFLEFTMDYMTDKEMCNNYIEFTNRILKEELSGYRIIDKKCIPITDEIELIEINKAIENTTSNSFEGAKIHIKTALSILSNKQLVADEKYRNVIKESISAVESICNAISGKKSDGLKNALKVIKSKMYLHPALEEGFKKLYGYTSDANGIRHSLFDAPELDLEDAIYMLVTCSAFVNYLAIKNNKL